MSDTNKNICKRDFRKLIIDWAKENHSVNVNDSSSYTRNSYWQSGANFMLPYIEEAQQTIAILELYRDFWRDRCEAAETFLSFMKIPSREIFSEDEEKAWYN